MGWAAMGKSVRRRESSRVPVCPLCRGLGTDAGLPGGRKGLHNYAYPRTDPVSLGRVKGFRQEVYRHVYFVGHHHGYPE
jgi:hypothetical protein